MSVVNTNVSASLAHAALAKNERALGTAMEQLSTGSKINSASDDAAGLAMAAKFTAQIKGLDMAVKNANDAVSMISTAEGALDEVATMLQRMRELAVQSSNGTVTAEDRDYMDLEYQALDAEITRIANNTQWNGENVLDGKAGAGGINGTSSSLVTFQISANYTAGTTTNTMYTTADVLPTGVSTLYSDGTTSAVAAGTVTNSLPSSTTAGGSTTGAITPGVYADIDALETAINSSGTGDFALILVAGSADTDGTQALVSGTTYTFESAGNPGHIFTFTPTLAATNFALDATATGAQWAAALSSGGYTAVSGIDSTVTTALNATIKSSSTAASNDVIAVDFGNLATDMTNVASSDVDTQTNANSAIDTLDLAIKAVNTQRATFGSASNRLEHAVDNMTNIGNNAEASRSRIEDTDYAETTSELAKAQIIAQAGTAMLAQANQSPQSVLSLLR